jgi:hypothetical protein
MKIFFQSLELVAFVLPALPTERYQRLSVVFVYFVMHVAGAQNSYARWKKDCLTSWKNV